MRQQSYCTLPLHVVVMATIHSRCAHHDQCHVLHRGLQLRRCHLCCRQIRSCVSHANHDAMQRTLQPVELLSVQPHLPFSCTHYAMLMSCCTRRLGIFIACNAGIGGIPGGQKRVAAVCSAFYHSHRTGQLRCSICTLGSDRSPNPGL